MGEPDWPALFDSPITAELAKVDIHSPADIKVREVAGRDILADYLHSQSVPINSDYYPFVDLHAGQARFARTNAEMFSSWLIAPLPVLEMLKNEQLEFDAITKTGYLSRLVHIEAADWLYDFIVDSIAEDKQSEEGRLLATWLREAAAYCEDDLDLNRWFTYVQDLMVASLPYMGPDKGNQLIDAIDRSQCETQQFPLIVRWFDLYRAVANRDAAAMATIGKELIEIMPMDAPGAHRGYLLDVLVLAQIAEGRFEAANTNWQRYGSKMYGDGPLPGYMQLLRALAEGGLPKD